MLGLSFGAPGKQRAYETVSIDCRLAPTCADQSAVEARWGTASCITQ
jgi:hypothetical protein